MPQSRPPEPCPAATGGLHTPSWNRSVFVTVRFRPLVRAAPLGLWQCAQLMSSQPRARASRSPVVGSSNTGAFGHVVGSAGAPTRTPLAIRSSSWWSRLMWRTLGPSGVTRSSCSAWQFLHWFLLGTTYALVRGVLSSWIHDASTVSADDVITASPVAASWIYDAPSQPVARLTRIRVSRSCLPSAGSRRSWRYANVLMMYAPTGRSSASASDHWIVWPGGTQIH